MANVLMKNSAILFVSELAKPDKAVCCVSTSGIRN